MRIAILIFVLGVYWGEAAYYPDAESYVDNEDVGIFGGHSITIEQAPFMASLRIANGTMHACGASIIHEKFLLSAAHCCELGEDYKIMVGTENVNGTNGELIDVKEVIPHPDFNMTEYNYDYCVIELETPITFSSRVVKVNLQESDDEKVLEGIKFNATGWGFADNFTRPEELQQIEIPYVDSFKCEAIYERMNISITPQMICAGNRGHVSCYGDSGSPLTHNNVQYGVTSWGDCEEPAVVYARVSSIIEWIKEIIEKHSDE